MESERMELYHRAMYVKMHERLEESARSAAVFAFSYRGFQVGCAVLAWNSKGRYKIFTGSNIKPEEDGPKVCAEQVAIGAARSEGYDLIVALAVAGEPQQDSVSGIYPPTLHPCWICRRLLGTLPEIRPDTVVLTLGNGNGVVEELSVETLLKMHSVCAPESSRTEARAV